jgi:hypothetical protein
LTGGEKRAADRLIVDGEIAVPVEHVERVAEFRQRADEGAAGADEFRAVERVVDGNAPRGAVAVSVDDFFTEVADAKDDARETVFFQQAELVRKERLARDLDEELRDFFGDRTQAGGEATGEDRDGERGGISFQKAA